MSMKYIVVSHGSAERIYIFDQTIMHAHFARSVSATRERIVAAGFVTADPDTGCRCQGVSSSLGIGSRGDRDTHLIQVAIGAPMVEGSKHEGTSPLPRAPRI